MKIEFTPSAKTLKKMEKIHELRLKQVFWDDVAKQVGHEKRYTQALYKYYREEILK